MEIKREREKGWRCFTINASFWGMMERRVWHVSDFPAFEIRLKFWLTKLARLPAGPLSQGTHPTNPSGFFWETGRMIKRLHDKDSGAIMVHVNSLATNRWRRRTEDGLIKPKKMKSKLQQAIIVLQANCLTNAGQRLSHLETLVHQYSEPPISGIRLNAAYYLQQQFESLN